MAAVLSQLGALRFVVSTEGADNASPSGTWTPGRHPLISNLTWATLQDATVAEQEVNTTSRLWLQPTFEAWNAAARAAAAGRGDIHAVACLADVSAPLLPALLGEAPLPGLSAVAPACKNDRLPKARAVSFGAPQP